MNKINKLHGVLIEDSRVDELLKKIDTLTKNVTAVASHNICVYIDDVPNTATQGTLVKEKVDILLQNYDNYICFDHEIYRLSANGHKEGYMTYFCIEYENNVPVVKLITITISTGAWVLNSVIIPTMTYEASTKTLNIEQG